LAKIFCFFVPAKEKRLITVQKRFISLLLEFQWLFDEDKEIQAARQAEAAHQKSGVHAQR